MPKIMDQLRKDHVHIAHLLDILEAQIAILDAAGHNDFELMHDIMLYMTRYPDWHHHPMEDLVFARLRARDVEATAVVERLEREHGALKEKGIRLLEMLACVVDGALVERAELSAVLHDYTQFLRSHKQVEERDAFPRAEQALEAEDWSWVASGMKSRDDPVFGPVLDEEFRSLYDFIERNRD